MSGMFVSHLRKTARLASDQIVRKVHKKRLMSDRRPCTENSMAQPQGFPLADINARDTFGNDALNGRQ